MQQKKRREFSAGGVVVRRFNGVWEFLAIRPTHTTDIWALPKGHIDEGEGEEQAALREVREETGVRTALDARVGDITYSFRGDGGIRITKTVAYFLLRWQSGHPMPQAEEVIEVSWFPLEQIEDVLSYPSERRIALEAAEILAERG